MPTLIKQFHFVASTNIEPNQVNANFDDIVSFVNNNVVHTDGTRAMTAHLSLVASDPSTDNQAARKAYVDSKTATVQASATAAQNTANTANATANAVADRVQNRIRWGTATGITNGAGDLAFPHGLGATPGSVVVTPITTGASANWRLTIENKDSNNVNIRAYNTTNGAALGGIGVSMHWFAAI